VVFSHTRSPLLDISLVITVKMRGRRFIVSPSFC
jgi:hypothetical protein